MIWVISLNNSLCHIYSYVPAEHKLTLLNTLENPSGRLKSGDLITDRPGHYQTTHSAKGAYQDPSDVYEVELDKFTKTIASLLKKELNNHSYTQTILCAASHVGGILLNNLNEQVKKTLLTHIKKNFIKEDLSQLANSIKENCRDLIRRNKINCNNPQKLQD